MDIRKKTNNIIKIIFIISLIILLKASVLFFKSSKEVSDENIVYSDFKDIKNKAAEFEYKDHSFIFYPKQKKSGLIRYGKKIDSQKKYLLKDNDIVFFKDNQFRFRLNDLFIQNTVICDEPVENILKTGSSAPAFITAGYKCLPGNECDNNPMQPVIRDIIILPFNKKFISILEQLTSVKLYKGSRIGGIYPPKNKKNSTPVFKGQLEGYRLKSFYDNIITIERDDTKFNLKAHEDKDFILKNNDIINFAGLVRIKFSIRKEKNLVFVNLIKTGDKKPLKKDIKPSAVLIPLGKAVNSEKIKLSSYKKNILLSSKQNYCFYKPFGRIPDRYKEKEIILEFLKYKENKDIELKGPFIEIKNKKIKNRSLFALIDKHNFNKRPLCFMVWTGDIYGRSIVKSSDSWKWMDKRPETWPHCSSKDNWKEARIISSKIYDSFYKLPDDAVPAWVGDYSIKNSNVRYYKYEINLSQNISKKENSLFVNSCAEDIILYINGKKVYSKIIYNKNYPYTYKFHSIDKYLKKGKNILLLKIEYPSLKKIESQYRFENKQILKPKEIVSRKKNNYTKGSVCDRDEKSLPYIQIIDSTANTFIPGAKILLKRSLTSEKETTKIIFADTAEKSFKVKRLYISANPEDTSNYVDLDFIKGKSNFLLLTNQTWNKKIISSGGKRLKPYTRLYKPYKNSEKPMNYCSSSGKGYFTNSGQKLRLDAGREHLKYKFFKNNKVFYKDLYYENRAKKYYYNNLIITDKKTVHSLILPDLQTDKKNLLYSQLSFETDFKKSILTLHNKNSEKNKKIELKNQEIYNFYGLTFKAVLKDNGFITAPALNKKREYKSYDSGFKAVLYSIVKPVFSDILNNGGKVNLTIDNDIQNIVNEEVQLQLKEVEKKYLSLKKTKERLLKLTKKPERRKKIKDELENINSFIPKSALIIINEDGEILSSLYTDYDTDKNKNIRLEKLTAKKDHKNDMLSNLSMEKPSFAPGSCFKILTAASVVDNNNKYINNFLKSDILINQNKIERDTILLNGKKAGASTKNYNHHIVEKRFNSINGSITKSYNNYFAYLGLLLNKTTAMESNYTKNPAIYWWRVFADSKLYKNNFPLTKVAENTGYNDFFNLMPHYDKNKIIDYINLPNSDSKLVIKSGFYPYEILNNSEVVKTSIGQYKTRSTPLINALTAITPGLEGKMPEPALIKSVYVKKGDSLKRIYKLKTKKVKIYSPKAAKIIKKGMYDVVNINKGGYGTATANFLDSKYTDIIYGKTGTAETAIKGLESNSWFVCFVKPKKNKIIAIAAVFPGAGNGNRHAGECVKRIIDKIGYYYGWETNASPR